MVFFDVFRLIHKAFGAFRYFIIDRKRTGAAAFRTPTDKICERGDFLKFFVGYRLSDDGAFLKEIIKNADRISEIYFSVSGFQNGRGHETENTALTFYEAEKRRYEELKTLSKKGFRLNLLLNGNCYGADALSRSFYEKIGELVDFLQKEQKLAAVTTTSPMIAKFIKNNFETLETRASVNMEIGTPEGFAYLSDRFDSFYLKREYNRDLKKLKAAADWCRNHGKKLHGLANSGCLNFCSARTFHDNLVSHEEEIRGRDNAYLFEGQCSEFLKNGENKNDWLRLSNFIRPEDVALYEDYFDGLKLATRQNPNPAAIVRAYCANRFQGAVTTLLEPDHSGVFYPDVIENSKIPSDFLKTVQRCSKNCTACNYCKTVQKEATVTLL